MDHYNSALSVPEAPDDGQCIEGQDGHQDLTSSLHSLRSNSAANKEPGPLSTDGWTSPRLEAPQEAQPNKDQNILLVHCNKIPGELHKAKFGGGSSGKCITMDGGKSFLTPKEFEAACGRASSKDWRGSIKFGSSSLKKLIKEKVLIQHSSVCGCLVCMDRVGDPILGDKTRPPPPVRLFTPYKKRRAKDSLSHFDKVPKKVMSGGGLPTLGGVPTPGTPTYISDINQALQGSAMGTIVSAGGDQVFVLSVPTATLSVPTATTSQIETASLSALPAPLEPISSSLETNTASIDEALKQSAEETFKHLEDIANSLINKAVELKQLIAEAREKTMHEIDALGKKDERIDLIDVGGGRKRSDNKRLCISQVGEAPSPVVSVNQDLNLIGVLGAI